VKDNRKTMLHIIICSILHFVAMMIFVCLNYIDFSVIKIIYLPILFIAIVAILFRQYIFGYIFIVSAELGLTVEYIIQLIQKNHPTMNGAFLNTSIICLGFIIGVTVQIIVSKVRRIK
jgi:hypothetical protein